MFSSISFRSAAAVSILFLVTLSTPFFSLANEISFSENISERVIAVDSGFAVVGEGTLSFNISVPMTGPTNFTGSTLLQFSMGDFHFSSPLSNAVDFVAGATSCTFVKVGTNTSGASVETGRIKVIWTRTSLTVSGTTSENFVIAENYLDTTGAFKQVVFANVAFGALSIVNRPVYISGKVTVIPKLVGTGVTAQEFNLDFVQASGAADYTDPGVAITSLVANARIVSTNVPGSTNFSVFTTNISGTAVDNVNVTQVLYRLAPAAQFSVANGTTNWIASNVTPIPGTNTFFVKATDADGNVSKVSSIKFFFSQLTRLNLAISGQGSITGLRDGQLLEIGRGYSMTATPTRPYLFSHWSGSLTSQVPTLKFLMLSNMTLQANFVPNPFFAAKGTYSGLFAETLSVELKSAGLMTLRLTDSGKFTGTIWMEGNRYPFAGEFHPSGTTEITIRRTSMPSLKLNLLLDFVGGVSGSIKEGNKWTARFEGRRRALFSVPGKFTILIPRNEISDTAPQGFGFATLSRSSGGNLKVTGTLADGTIFSQSTSVSPTGSWPMFSSLYRGKGLLHCAMQFPTDPNNDIYGEPITWLKTTNALNRFYTNGFALAGPVVGSPYNPLLLIGWETGSLERGAGNLSSPRTNQVSVGDNDSLSIISTDNVTLRLNSSGLLNGTFIHPNTGRTTALKGAYLQKLQFGAGFFLGSSQSGYFMLQAAH